ncbi:hypothetical protein NDA07_06935 [Microcoleus vaginatus DQ-U2]|uniref:hypothetical protein n=1 Tax=Microcoleus vaginatus TaxID=119532 RepID=UPI00168333B8|nr:hypothetical protein [Microcoleus sp. FACHB-DQ6]
MIFRNKPTQKNDSQMLTDISLKKDKSNQLWSELSETSEAAVSGGYSTPRPPMIPLASIK